MFGPLRIDRRIRFTVVFAIIGILLFVGCRQTEARPDTGLTSAHLIGPEEFVTLLQSSGPKPLILNVGPQMLYRQAHIPQAEYIGDGVSQQARERLRQRVQPLPRDAAIVLYCGCCPWAYCPNVNPAYGVLERMGFTNVKVLKIDNDFGADWIEKGYPIDRPSG